MSLEHNLADLVSATTQLTTQIAVPQATLLGIRDSAIANEAPAETARIATATAATGATGSASTVSTKLDAVVTDYNTQKTNKGLPAVLTSADTELKDRLHRLDPANYLFRGTRPSLVMDFVRRECHRNNAAGLLEPVNLDSFMTFTRASSAWVTGPDGSLRAVAANVPRYDYDPLTGECKGLLIEEVRTNIIGYSQNPEIAGVSTINATVRFNPAVAGPDGTLSTRSFTRTSTSASYALIVHALGAGTILASSLYVKKLNASYVSMRIQDNVSPYTSQANVIFNLDTGTIAQAASVAVEMTSPRAGISPVGDGWYRIWLSATTGTGISTRTLFSCSDQISRIDGGSTDGNEAMYFTCVQSEVGAFPTSYIPTPAIFTGRASIKTYFDSNGVMQTAGVGVAVIDYGYVDNRWVSKGLMLEPQATNLLTNSGDLSTWAKTDASTAISPILAPDGISYAIRLIESANTTPHYISRTPTVAYNTQYTGSVYLKAAERSKACINMHLGSGNVSGYFDLANGTILTIRAGGTATITSVGNGWYRCTVTATTAATGTPNMAIFTLNAAGAQTYAGDGMSGIYVWAGQYEAGPIATSYIPTTSTQVTRAADTSTSAQVTRAMDVASADVTTLTNRDACTAFAIADVNALGGLLYPGIFALYRDGTPYTRMGTWVADPTDDHICGKAVDDSMGGAAQSITIADSTDTVAPNTIFTSAIRRQNNTYRLAANGGLHNYASVGTPFKLTRLTIGNFDNPLNGHIRQFTYFPRALSDADLQALTILED